MIKAVIFDLDGTLLDTLEDLANACNYALKSCGFKIHDVKDYTRFVGNGRYKLIERIVPDKYKEDLHNLKNSFNYVVINMNYLKLS